MYTSDISDPSEMMDSSIDDFIRSINALKINQTTKSGIYKLVVKLLNQINDCNTCLLKEDNGMDTTQVLNMSTYFIVEKLTAQDSAPKREKLNKSLINFVAPVERALGVRYKVGTYTPSIDFVPAKFGWVFILKTLKAVFARKDVRDAYCRFNESHGPRNGVFRDFRDGSLFKNNAFFSNNPDALQIEISTDDFEICNPIGSKATLHKCSGFYFRIRNMPSEYSSRIDNIYLICLCNADDLKTEYTDLNDIWRLIVHDISYLEEHGIVVDEDFILKGTIVNITCDNLGANSSMGMVESFKAHHFCRICEADKAQCKIMTAEDETKLRNVSRYNDIIAQINDSDKVDYKKSFGIKRYCELNDLKFFHTCVNFAVDIMHDLNEGVIPFLLKKFFSLIVKLKILSEVELVRKIQYFHFGILDSGNIPSAVMLEKSNLNQNASQSKCLFKNVPFIFHDLIEHDQLVVAWACVRTLLKITQIVYSSEITTDDLDNLENLIGLHLKQIQRCFDCELIPKHHFLTHYCTVIRKMGPLINMSMIRFEAKHKAFKQYIRISQCFRNVSFTLASHHQRIMLNVNDSYCDRIRHGRLTNVTEIYQAEHRALFANNQNVNDLIYSTKYLSVNGTQFQVGFYVQNECSLFEILDIIKIRDSFHFYCNKVKIIEYYSSLNSIAIESENSESHACLLNLEDINKQFVHEKKQLLGSSYITLENLSLRSLYAHCSV